MGALLQKVTKESLDNKKVNRLIGFLEEKAGLLEDCEGSRMIENPGEVSEKLSHFNLGFLLLTFLRKRGSLDVLMEKWFGVFSRAYKFFLINTDLPLAAKRDSVFYYLSGAVDFPVDRHTTEAIFTYNLNELYVNDNNQFYKLYKMFQIFNTKDIQWDKKLLTNFINKTIETIVNSEIELNPADLVFVHPIFSLLQIGDIKKRGFKFSRNFEKNEFDDSSINYISFFQSAGTLSKNAPSKKDFIVNMLRIIFTDFGRFFDNQYLDVIRISDFLIEKVTKKGKLDKTILVLLICLITENTCHIHEFVKNVLFLTNIAFSVTNSEESILLIGLLVSKIAKLSDGKIWQNIVNKLFEILISFQVINKGCSDNQVNVLAGLLTFILKECEGGKIAEVEEVFINTVVKICRNGSEFSIFLLGVSLLFLRLKHADRFGTVLDKVFLFAETMLLTKPIENQITLYTLSFLFKIIVILDDGENLQKNDSFILKKYFGVVEEFKKSEAALDPPRRSRLRAYTFLLDRAVDSRITYLRCVFQPSSLFDVFMKNIAFNSKNVAGILRLAKVFCLTHRSAENDKLFKNDMLALYNYCLIYDMKAEYRYFVSLYNEIDDYDKKEGACDDLEKAVTTIEGFFTDDENFFRPYLDERTVEIIAKSFILLLNSIDLNKMKGEEVVDLSRKIFQIIVKFSDRKGWVLRKNIATLIFCFLKRFKVFNDKGAKGHEDKGDSLVLIYSAPLEGILRLVK